MQIKQNSEKEELNSGGDRNTDPGEQSCLLGMDQTKNHCFSKMFEMQSQLYLTKNLGFIYSVWYQISRFLQNEFVNSWKIVLPANFVIVFLTSLNISLTTKNTKISV